jgi:hypothetical protein
MIFYHRIVMRTQWDHARNIEQVFVGVGAPSLGDLVCIDSSVALEFVGAQYVCDATHELAEHAPPRSRSPRRDEILLALNIDLATSRAHRVQPGAFELRVTTAHRRLSFGGSAALHHQYLTRWTDITRIVARGIVRLIVLRIDLTSRAVNSSLTAICLPSTNMT